MTRLFASLDEVTRAVGERLGPTGWTQVGQATVDQFAEVTGDHQWIHVDVERAQESAFGGTIAHGYLTLSLLPKFASELYRIDAGDGRLNYGLDKVRFPATLPVGTRIRASVTFLSVTEAAAGAQVTTRWVVETEGSEKPVCVADTVTLVVG
jgi:acyl dehydratase